MRLAQICLRGFVRFSLVRLSADDISANQQSNPSFILYFLSPAFSCANNRAVLNITMSFGFRVGDFIAAIELANKIRKEFIDAPGQFKDISDEYEILSNHRPMLIHFHLAESEASQLSFKTSRSYRNESLTTNRRKSFRRSQAAVEMYLRS